MLLHESFTDAAQRLPGKTALVCDDRRYTYGELDRAADKLAVYLRHRGVQRGDRVAVFLDNGAEVVVGIYAALRAGAVFTPINPATKKEKLRYLLNDCQASALITDWSLRQAWQGALGDNRSIHTCVVTGAGGELPRDRCVSYASALEHDHPPENPLLIDHDLAAIIYTSGSTADAKGVMLSHLNMVSARRSVTTYLGLVQEDVILCALPFAFDYGLYQLLMAFDVGATLVVGSRFALAPNILETVARERVTVLPGVPTLFAMLLGLDSIASYDLRSLRLITNTAAALPEPHIRALRQTFAQARLFSMYGLTECKRVSYLPPEELDRRPGSVGRGMPNQEIWLVGERGERLPNGSTGELVVRGSHVMRGYWGKPAETAERLKPSPYPGELVLHSGDIFRTDQEGFLYFVGRTDDIIKSRGEKVSPREVENALYALDGVHEVAVIGVPDPLLGEAVKAFVALRPGVDYSEREIIQHCRRLLENYMVPKYVQLVERLPKTDTGKIKKRGLV